ncbi:hypothetical protein PJL18_02163 [Paenarthrobacter nicotinovorans]|nr:hypothetical protein [Paenarthrobacter nicotinovorans]
MDALALHMDQYSFAVKLGVAVHFTLQLSGVVVLQGVTGQLGEAVEGSDPVDLQLLRELPAGRRQDHAGHRHHNHHHQQAEDAQDPEFHGCSTR